MERPMMTITAFNALDLDDKVDVVEQHGIYVLSTQCDDHQHIYYRIDDLMVEMVQVYEGLFVDEVEAFAESDERMEQLLEHIQPDELVDVLGFPPPAAN